MIGRRLFLGGMLIGLAAPAIVRAESLMKVVVPKRHPLMDMEIGYTYSMSIIVDDYVEYAHDGWATLDWVLIKPETRILCINSVQAKDNGVYVVERESIVTPKQRERRKWQLQRRL